MNSPWKFFESKVPVAVLLCGTDYSDALKDSQKFFSFRCQEFQRLEKPKVSELKELNAWINTKPSSEFKVIEIQQVEEVSEEALNYLLKAVEESPVYLKWVLFSGTKYINKALQSRCFCVALPEKETIRSNAAEFQVIENLDSAYVWLVNAKETLPEQEFKDILIDCCDSLMQKQNNFDKIRLVQHYKNLIRRESVGYDNTFKTLLSQVF